MIDERSAARPTAYVLGEMTPEEKAAFEQEMSESEQLRAEVDEIREMASLLDREMAQGKAALPPEMRSRIEAAATAKASGEKGEQQKKNGVGPVSPDRGPVLTPAPAASPKRPRRVGLWIGAGAVTAMAASLLLFNTAHYSRGKYADEAAPPSMAYATAAATAAYNAPPPPVATAVAATPMGIVAADAPAGAGRMRGDMGGQAGQLKPDPSASHDRFEGLPENPFLKPATDPLSTFSIDVDTASYSIVRSQLQSGSLPPAEAVRIEEMINYFDYKYSEPDGAPFQVQLDVANAPWASDHRLVRVGLKGKTVSTSMMDGVNLVFLVDTSGSMSDANKLPLLKQGFRQMVDHLRPTDRVAIVAYAGSAGLVLPSTPVSDREKVLGALDRLAAGGSTNGGAGIDLAYKVAAENFFRGGVNRVLLATDGDFNVGTTSNQALVELIQQKAKTGVFLSVLGFGRGNFNDALLEKIADKGNGQYAYIDNETEVKRAMVDGLGSMVTIAKDVKIQIEWNPAEVAAYRLIGYENRVMAASDFNNDRKDAGELGSGHTVTALYEVIPAGGSVPGGGDLKYQTPAASGGAKANAAPGEMLTVKLRYKEPDSETSKLLEQALTAKSEPAAMSQDFKFAAAVASFGMLLRHSKNAGTATLGSVLQMAESSAGDDDKRREFVTLVRKAMTIAPPEMNSPKF